MKEQVSWREVLLYSMILYISTYCVPSMCCSSFVQARCCAVGSMAELVYMYCLLLGRPYSAVVR